MEDYEYKVIPAPVRTVKVKGLKTASERFAHLLTEALNEAAAEGWEYVRAETLPCEERKGLFGKARSNQAVLIFRRALAFEPEEVSGAGAEAGSRGAEVFHHAEPEPPRAPHSAHPIPRFRAEPALGQASPGQQEIAARREPSLRARADDEATSRGER